MEVTTLVITGVQIILQTIEAMILQLRQATMGHTGVLSIVLLNLHIIVVIKGLTGMVELNTTKVINF